MERAGYVEKRAFDGDGRGHTVSITKAGRAIRKKMWPVYANAIEEAVGQHLSDEQAGTLGDLLGNILGKDER